MTGDPPGTRRRRPAPPPRSLPVQAKISARHGHLGDAAQVMIREKAEKLLHYFGRVAITEVAAGLREDMETVEVLVSAEHKHGCVARESNGELQVALDLA